MSDEMEYVAFLEASLEIRKRRTVEVLDPDP
jgi:hypothetical protein